MMRVSPWAILGILVVGCSGKGDDTAAVLAQCGDWSGVQSDATEWVWTKEVDTTTADLTSQITAMTSDGFTLASSYHYFTVYVDATIDTTETYACDADGMSLLKSTENSDIVTTDEGESLDTKVTLYDTPYLVLPLTLRDGDTWEANAKGTTEDSAAGATHAFDYTTTSTVASSEDLSVTAGDFSTLRVEQEAAGATLKFWYAEGVGLVQADDRELKRYTP